MNEEEMERRLEDMIDREEKINILKHKELKSEIQLNKYDSSLMLQYTLLGAITLMCIFFFDINNFWTLVSFLLVPYLYFGYIRPDIKRRDKVAETYNYYVEQINDMYDLPILQISLAGTLDGAQNGNDET